MYFLYGILQHWMSQCYLVHNSAGGTNTILLSNCVDDNEKRGQIVMLKYTLKNPIISLLLVKMGLRESFFDSFMRICHNSSLTVFFNSSYWLYLDFCCLSLTPTFGIPILFELFTTVMYLCWCSQRRGCFLHQTFESNDRINLDMVFQTDRH